MIECVGAKISTARRALRYHVPVRVLSLWSLIALMLVLSRSAVSVGVPSGEDATCWTLIMRWPGMDAKGLEELVALPLEDGLAGIPGFESARLTCTADELRGRIILQDRETALRVTRFLESLHAELPPDVPRPVFSAVDPDDRPFWVAAVTSSDCGADSCRLRDELLGLEGAGSCELAGLGEEEILVVPEEERVTGTLLSLSGIVSPLRTPGRPLDGGQGVFGGQKIPLIVSGGEGKTIEGSGLFNVAQIPVPWRKGLRLGALGETRRIRREPSSRSYLDGRPLVMISVTAAAGADKRLLSRAIAGVSRRFCSRYPETRIEVLEDEGEALEASWRELLWAAAASLALVFIASFLVCRQGAGSKGGMLSSVLCACCVPFVVLFAVMLLLLFGQHLDRTLLTALAISSGFTIDAFLVVMELFHAPQRRGMEDLRLPVLTRVLVSSSGTTIIALVPLCLLAQNDLSLVGMTLLATTFVSFFVARFFLLPLLHWLHTLPRAVPDTMRCKAPSGRKGRRSLAAAARFLYRYRRLHLCLWALMILASLLCIPSSLDRVIVGEERVIPFSLSFDPGTSRSVMARRIEVFSQDIGQRLHNGVSVWALLAGDQARGSVCIDSADISGRAVLEAMRSIPLEGGSVHAGHEGSGEHWWEVRVYSATNDDAREAAQRFARLIESEALVLHFRRGNPRLSLVPKRAAVAGTGLDVAGMSAGVRRMLQGVVVGKLSGPDREYDIRLLSGAREAPFDTLNAPDVETLKGSRLALGYGQSFSVGSLFTFSGDTGPVSLEREGRQALARLSFATKTSSLSAARALFERTLQKYERLLDTMDAPGQAHLVFDPEACTQSQSTLRLVALIVVAAVFCVLFLGCVDNALRGPLLCLLSLVPALAIVFPVMLLFSLSAGPPSICGAILLSGLGINAAILCLERLEGRPSSARSLYSLWRHRLPLVMTTSLTSVFSCLPFALLGGGSTALARDLSIVCIAGILLSALSSLVFLPLVRGAFSFFSAPKDVGT